MNSKPNKNKSSAGPSATACACVIAFLLLILGLPASADCPSLENPAEFPVSDAVREFYEDACRDSDSPLVFSLDSSVKSRLQLPTGGHRLTEDDIYPEKARHLAFEGSVVVAFVVELDGTVKRSKLMQSSGHRVLDAAEWIYWQKYKFDSPGQLDGAPARVLILERMNFKLKGGVGLPASFSDWVVENLARRILQPYALNDANALYEDLDATAKTTTSPTDIQKRFATYSEQYGAMGFMDYRGLAGVKNIGGVPHFELAYLVRAKLPKTGTATLIVTAIDATPRAGITGFDLKESNIRDYLK